jgi:NDP-sugar pyrophosphorylase family protein
VQVVNGELAASKVTRYVQKEPALQDLTMKVVTAPAASRSADAVRAVADSLVGDHVVVMSGDTVTDVPVATVVFTHRIRGAAITTVLSKRPTSASSVTKLGKPPKVRMTSTNTINRVVVLRHVLP